MLIEKIAKLAINLLFIGLIAKQVGPDSFGYLSFCQSILTILLSISGLGLDNILINEFIIHEKQKRKKIFSTVFWSRIFVGCFFSIICVLYVIIESSMTSEKAYILIFTICTLIFYSQNTYLSYFQSISEYKIISKISLISTLLVGVVKCFIIYFNLSIVFFSFVLMFELFLNLLLILLVTKRNDGISIRFEEFDYFTLVELLKQSWPVIVSSILVVLYTRLDHFMIAKMLGVKELGLFSVAVRIADAYVFIPSLIVTSFYPMLCNDFTKKAVRFYFDIVFLSALFCCLFIVSVCPLLIPILFGNDYLDAIRVTQITIFSSLFSVLGGAITNYFLILNMSYQRLIRACVGLIANFVLNIFLIPKYGIEGAAFASLIAQIFAVWISNVFSIKTRECFYIETKTILSLGSSVFLKLLNKRMI